MFIDSHAHLDDERFNEDRQAVIERALASGVGRMINPGADEASSRRAVSLAYTHEAIMRPWASIPMMPKAMIPKFTMKC